MAAGEPPAKKPRQHEDEAVAKSSRAGASEAWCWAERAGDGIDEIKELLATMGLEHYHALFVALGFDTMASVRAMQEEDMRDEIRMADEHIKILRHRIKELPSPPPIPAPPPPLPAAPPGQGAEAEVEQDGPTRAELIQELQQLQKRLDDEAEEQEAKSREFQALAAKAEAENLERAMKLEAAARELEIDPVPAMPADLLTLAAAGHLPAGDQTDISLFALLQLAEEAAQMAVAANAFVANPLEFALVSPVAEAAEMAAERARWAAKLAAGLSPPAEKLTGVTDVWLALVRECTWKAAQVADHALESCKAAKEEMAKYLPQNTKKQSKLPCKHFLEKGTCREGHSCRFSHDPKDSKARPIMMKRQEICRFFKSGKCARGAACAWAHGDEELEEVTKYVCQLRDEKFQMKRAAQKAYQNR